MRLLRAQNYELSHHVVPDLKLFLSEYYVMLLYLKYFICLKNYL